MPTAPEDSDGEVEHKGGKAGCVFHGYAPSMKCVQKIAKTIAYIPISKLFASGKRNGANTIRATTYQIIVITIFGLILVPFLLNSLDFRSE